MNVHSSEGNLVHNLSNIPTNKVDNNLPKASIAAKDQAMGNPAKPLYTGTIPNIKPPALPKEAEKPSYTGVIPNLRAPPRPNEATALKPNIQPSRNSYVAPKRSKAPISTLANLQTLGHALQNSVSTSPPSKADTLVLNSSIAKPKAEISNQKLSNEFYQMAEGLLNEILKGSEELNRGNLEMFESLLEKNVDIASIASKLIKDNPKNERKINAILNHLNLVMPLPPNSKEL